MFKSAAKIVKVPANPVVLREPIVQMPEVLTLPVPLIILKFRNSLPEDVPVAIFLLSAVLLFNSMFDVPETVSVNDDELSQTMALLAPVNEILPPDPNVNVLEPVPEHVNVGQLNV